MATTVNFPSIDAPVTVAPSLPYASGDQPYALNITVEGVEMFDSFDITIIPTSIASLEAFGTAVILTGPTSVLPSSIASQESFGTATVLAGSVIISPSSITSAESFGTPTLFTTVTLVPTSIASLEAFGLTVISSTVTVTPVSIASEETFGEATVLLWWQFLTPNSILSAESFSIPCLIPPRKPPLPTHICAIGFVIGEQEGASPPAPQGQSGQNVSQFIGRSGATSTILNRGSASTSSLKASGQKGSSRLPLTGQKTGCPQPDPPYDPGEPCP